MAHKREVLANDLELFTINTGQFYKYHQSLVGQNAWAWIKHIRDNALPHYCREIEPVWATEKTVHEVAVNVMNYYQEHAAEIACLKYMSEETEGDPS